MPPEIDNRASLRLPTSSTFRDGRPQSGPMRNTVSRRRRRTSLYQQVQAVRVSQTPSKTSVVRSHGYKSRLPPPPHKLPVQDKRNRKRKRNNLSQNLNIRWSRSRTLAAGTVSVFLPLPRQVQRQLPLPLLAILLQHAHLPHQRRAVRSSRHTGHAHRADPQSSPAAQHLRLQTRGRGRRRMSMRRRRLDTSARCRSLDASVGGMAGARCIHRQRLI